MKDEQVDGTVEYLCSVKFQNVSNLEIDLWNF